MLNNETVTLRGAAGTVYPFTVYPWGTPFQDFGAIYLVLRRAAAGDYRVLYIGRTAHLSERFESHHKNGCFRQHGRTHIAVHAEPSAARRQVIETDLILAHTTPCNG